MKKIVIALTVVASVLLVSCTSSYTCPTYMKIDDKQINKVEESARV